MNSPFLGNEKPIKIDGLYRLDGMTKAIAFRRVRYSIVNNQAANARYYVKVLYRITAAAHPELRNMNG